MNRCWWGKDADGSLLYTVYMDCEPEVPKDFMPGWRRTVDPMFRINWGRWQHWVKETPEHALMLAMWLNDRLGVCGVQMLPPLPADTSGWRRFLPMNICHGEGWVEVEVYDVGAMEFHDFLLIAPSPPPAWPWHIEPQPDSVTACSKDAWSRA